MKRPAKWFRFIAARLDRRALDREMDDEMALHIELHEEALRRQGLSPDEARRRARLDFGGVERYREQGREARSLSWVHDLTSDIRYGARALRRSPGFTLVAVLSLAVGLGATTSIFGVVYGTLLQRLAIPHADELAALAVSANDGQYTEIRRRDYLALRGASGAPRLEAVNETNDVRIEVGNVGAFAALDFVEPGYFDLLGLRPVVGRVIGRSDEGQPVVVIGDRVWNQVFARDPSVIGKTLSIKGQPFTVIGVMPASFRGVQFAWRFGMAVPQSVASSLGSSDDGYVHVITRIEPGESRTSIAAWIDAAFRRCCLEGRRNPSATRLTLVDASRGVPGGKDDFRSDYRLVLWALLAGVFLVLAVACSNVGNLLLARGAARERELAVRLAIGASRGRIIRQLLAESALLAALGGVSGFLLAAVATGLLVRTLPPGSDATVALVEFHAKPAILAFTTLVSIGCVFVFGLGPALRATRGDLVSPIKTGGGAAARRRVPAIDRLLVIGQVAVALVLICAASLLVATLQNLRTIDPGFAADHLIMVNIETRATAFERDGIVPIHEELLALARSVPGVQSAGMATRIPAFGGRNVSMPYVVVGDAPPPDGTELDITAITPGYFATAGTRLSGGRDFDAADTPTSARVAVVNEAFVRRHFAARSAIGAQVRLDELNSGETVTIVGVVHDVRFGDRRSRQDPMLYVPTTQSGKWPFLLLMVRSAEPRRLVMPIERAIGSYSKGLRIGRWTTMEASFDETILRERLAAGIGGTSAVLALVLAMVGLSGIVGFSVTRRTREIGVRMALGARRDVVVWLVLRGALVMCGLGVVIGAPLALGAGRVLGTLLFGIGAANPFVLGGAASGLLIVSMIASAAPALRASRVDPVTSLRAD